MHTAHRRALVLLTVVLAMACTGSGLTAPGWGVNGTWRGQTWGLDARVVPARLYHLCGYHAIVAEPLRWSEDLTLTGTAEYAWNADTGGPDVEFSGRLVAGGALELTIVADAARGGGSVHELRRAPNAVLQDFTCE